MRQQRYSLGTPAQTYVKQGNGGLFGGLMSGVSSGIAGRIACFPAGTMVATPTGAVDITDLKAGDTVITVAGMDKVKALHDMGESSDLYYIFDGKHKLTTTGTEVLLTDRGREAVMNMNPGERVMTTHGLITVQQVNKLPGKSSNVYELEMEDPVSMFYAEGYAVEPISQAELKPKKRTRKTTRKVKEA